MCLKRTGNMNSFCKEYSAKNEDKCIADRNILIFSFINSFNPFKKDTTHNEKCLSVSTDISGQTLCGNSRVDFSEAVIGSVKSSIFICQKPHVDLLEVGHYFVNSSMLLCQKLHMLCQRLQLDPS